MAYKLSLVDYATKNWLWFTEIMQREGMDEILRWKENDCRNGDVNQRNLMKMEPMATFTFRNRVQSDVFEQPWEYARDRCVNVGLTSDIFDSKC